MIDQKVRLAASVPNPVAGREILWLAAAGWMRRLFDGTDVAIAGAPAAASPHLIGQRNPYAISTTVVLAGSGMPALAAMNNIFLIAVCLTADGGYAVGDKLRFGLAATHGIFDERAGVIEMRTSAVTLQAVNLTANATFNLVLANWRLDVYGVW